MHPGERPRRSRPLGERNQTIPLTSPLRSMPVFRPAPYLAVAAILLPFIAAGSASTLLLNQNRQAPIWVPLLLLLFIPLLALAWLLMRSVRLSPVGISVGRPFQRWHEAMWHEIVRAEKRGILIRISTSGGDSISFAPRLLMDGDQLLGIILNHLRPQILDGALRQAARDHMPIPEADMTGILRARPRSRWPFSGFLLSLAGVVGAILAVIMLPGLPGLLLGVVGALVALAGLAIALWLLQEVILTPEGMTVIRPWQRSPIEVVWNDVKVLDHSIHWALLRFRVGGSVRCIGPSLLRAPERDRMFAFLKRYCLRPDVLRFPHKWLF